jgi:hypothetical protein
MWSVQSWIDAAQFTLEAQTVIAMRLMKIAAGGTERDLGIHATRVSRVSRTDRVRQWR